MKIFNKKMNNGMLNSDRRESYPSGLREKPLLLQMSAKFHRKSSENILTEQPSEYGYRKFQERGTANVI
jgi:hypothetical protein